MRHALRVLGREKAFAAFAILTLALGIGAVTTIFSVVDRVLLKPLAYKEPGAALCGCGVLAQTGSCLSAAAGECGPLPVLAGTVPVLRVRGVAEPGVVQPDWRWGA